MRVRPLLPDEAVHSARLHREVLGMEFLARFGTRFLAAYHRAWIRSPAGLALAATDEDDRVAGVMLGTLTPAVHYRWMLLHAGPALVLRLVGGALREPALARDLVVTRAARYVRGVWRYLTAPPPRPADPEGPRSGEVTHLMVSPQAQGGGVGRALLAETESRAVALGVARLVLVTPPDLDARRFYEHLGWEVAGEVTSRSGEVFVRFVRHLGGAVPLEPAGEAHPEGVGSPDGTAMPT